MLPVEDLPSVTASEPEPWEPPIAPAVGQFERVDVPPDDEPEQG